MVGCAFHDFGWKWAKLFSTIVDNNFSGNGEVQRVTLSKWSHYWLFIPIKSKKKWKSHYWNLEVLRSKFNSTTSPWPTMYCTTNFDYLFYFQLSFEVKKTFTNYGGVKLWKNCCCKKYYENYYAYNITHKWLHLYLWGCGRSLLGQVWKEFLCGIKVKKLRSLI